MSDDDQPVQPKKSERVCTNWYKCPKCNETRSPDPRRRCTVCGTKLVVKSSGDW